MGQWNLEAVMAAFSDAAVDPSQWTRALNTITEETRSFGAFLVPIAGGRAPSLPISERMERALEAYFAGNWHLRDDRIRGVDIMRKRGVVDDLDISSFEEIKRRAYYQDFLAPVGLRWFAGVNVASGEDLWCLSIQRKINQEPFSPEEKNRLAVLSSHLSSVAAIARALGFSAASAALEAFEVSNTAVLLLNRLGQIIRVNRSAENLLTGDIKISGRRLVAADASASAALDRRLHQLLWARTGAALGPPTPLPRFCQRPLLAYLLKLSALTTNILSDCQAAIVLIDPDKRWRPPEASLRVSFGLTAAEAKLAARIASGESLENIAEELGVTKETSRNQLKSIFQKTGVHRQAELVAIFARLLTR